MMWWQGDLVPAAEEGAPPTRVWPLKQIDRSFMGGCKRWDKYMYVMRAVDGIIAATNGIDENGFNDLNPTTNELVLWWGHAWPALTKVWEDVKHKRKFARYSWITWADAFSAYNKKEKE